MLRNRRVLRCFFACVLAFLTQQLGGVNVITFYSLTLFEFGGSGDLTGSEQTVVVSSVQILSCLAAMRLIDTFGRRILLVVSSALMGLFLILLGKRLPPPAKFASLTRADNARLVNATRTSRSPVAV